MINNSKHEDERYINIFNNKKMNSMRILEKKTFQKNIKTEKCNTIKNTSMKKIRDNIFFKNIFFINTKAYFKYKTLNHILLILIIVSVFLFKNLSKVNCNLRKINSIEEIILTIDGTGEKSILNKNYNYPPDEIEIDGNRFTFEGEGDNRYVFNLTNSTNIVKVYYNTSPESFNNMFNGLSSITKIDFSNFDSSNLNDMTKMFYNCKDLEEVNMNGLKTSKVTSMEAMFKSCVKIKSIDLSSFDTSLVRNMKCMFESCSKLEYINVSNFNTISVTDMTSMFSYCNLQMLDLSSFEANGAKMGSMFRNNYRLNSIIFSETNKIQSTDLSSMFQDCRNIEYLDLSNFDTSLTTNMAYLFDNCYKLISVNLGSFNTTSVKSFMSMFSYCSTLESLDLSNFVTKYATNMGAMFQHCTSLIFLNIESFIINNDTYKDNILLDLNENIKLCISQENAGLTSLDNLCEDDCFIKTNKLIKELKKCIDDCSKDDTYQYEYNNKCYTSCPDGTTSSINNEFICVQELVDEKYCNIDNTECFSEKPNGYYLVDEENKIIDKCHDNCKTCNQKGTSDNNNCLTCNENDYFYNGNCLQSCNFGSYTDNSGKKICTCNSNIKCKECSDESLLEDLCISCNTDYYPKIDENLNNDLFVKCYNEVEGYYLDNNKKYYYPCYTTCEQCSEEGNKDNHNCNQCIQNYYFIDELNKEKNCYEKCQFYYYFNSDNEYACTQTSECPTEQSKLIIAKKKCIDKCSNDNTYINEYNNECYKECPDNTILENNICKDKDKISDKTIINEDSDINSVTKSSENIDNWSAENFFLGLYIPEGQNILSKDDIIKNIREDIINHNLDNLISNVITEKEDIYIKDKKVLYQITTSDNQNNNTYTNISSIKLGECEKILKDKYKIDDNETLIILKIDYYLEGLLIPIIGYEVYEPKNKSKLNLSVCEESSISYNIPVTIDEDNLFKYDPNSEYYNDECNTYTTENGTDIILNDRKEEFKDNNMSLCENICEYVGYDIENKKAICECGIRYKELLLSEIDNDNNLLANNFSIDNSTLNIGSMKCYDTLFSKDGLLTNIGSYILIIIIVLHLISIIIFYKCGYYILTSNIKEIMNEKKNSKKPENGLKNINNKKNNIYEFEPKKEKKLKKKNSITYNISRKEELAKIKKKKSSANPIKKLTRRKSLKNQDNSNTNSNVKSITRLTLKENKIVFNFERKKRKKNASSKIIKKNNINEEQYKPKNINMLLYNDFELNTMDYNDALNIDKRTLWQYYCSLIRTKQPIMFSFFPNKDYNITVIKVCLFFFSFSIYFALNTFFFNFTVIHKIYEEEGNYNFLLFIPQIMYSFIISYFINILIKYFVLSERNLLELKKEKVLTVAKEKSKKIENNLIIKNTCYFIIGFIFLGFFWYYLSSFCAIYQNSQVSLIKNTFISFAVGLIYPFGINFLPAIIRRISLSDKNRECIYKTSKFIQIL